MNRDGNDNNIENSNEDSAVNAGSNGHNENEDYDYDNGKDSDEGGRYKEKMGDDEITYYDDDEAYDDSGIKVKMKLSKEQIINRIMVGMGIVIASFTIFYGFVVYGILNPKTPAVQEPESQSQVIEEPTTTEYIDTSLFVSPYSDKNIAQATKTKLNKAELEPMKTGLVKLDSKVDTIMSKVVDKSKTTYENVRNIYDYLLYNFSYQNKSYVDEDSVYDTCSSVNYVSLFDMKIIYRANKSLNNNAGSPDDYACAFMIMLRRLGLEAYYIDGAIYNDEGKYESHGYTIVVLDDEYYIFDPAYDALLMKESENKGLNNSGVVTEQSAGDYLMNTTDEETYTDLSGDAGEEDTSEIVIEYMSFGKTFDEMDDIYTTDDVEGSIKAFSEFETLGGFYFEATFSTDDGGSATGSVNYTTGYSEDGNSVNATGEISIYTDDKVFINGLVSGSASNTWKLVAKIYDEDMNYIAESTIYSENTSSVRNQISYSPNRPGNIRLVYMVTDANGRTCAISKVIKVRSRYSYENETTTRYRETYTETETETETTTSYREETTSSMKQDETTTGEEETTSYREETTSTMRQDETTTAEETTRNTTEEPGQEETTEPVVEE